MSAHIGEEVLLILMSIYGGLILILCYDAIRIFRRVFHCGLARVIIEDILYWTIASIYIFEIYLKYNFGRPRFFSIVITLGVMAIFEVFIGSKIIDKAASILWKTINILSKPLKKLYKMIKLKLYVKSRIKEGIKYAKATGKNHSNKKTKCNKKKKRTE